MQKQSNYECYYSKWSLSNHCLLLRSHFHSSAGSVAQIREYTAQSVSYNLSRTRISKHFYTGVAKCLQNLRERNRYACPRCIDKGEFPGKHGHLFEVKVGVLGSPSLLIRPSKLLLLAIQTASKHNKSMMITGAQPFSEGHYAPFCSQLN